MLKVTGIENKVKKITSFTYIICNVTKDVNDLPAQSKMGLPIFGGL